MSPKKKQVKRIKINEYKRKWNQLHQLNQLLAFMREIYIKGSVVNGTSRKEINNTCQFKVLHCVYCYVCEYANVLIRF